MANHDFKVGEIVEHVLNREWLLIIQINDNTLKCRTKKFDILEFNICEIQKKKQ